MRLPREIIFAILAISLAVTGCHGPKDLVTDEVVNSELQEKYAELLEVEPAMVQHHELYSFVDEWLGTPYKYGGSTLEGVDCSGFCGALYLNVYGETINRRARDIADQCDTFGEQKLQEGDFVFFKIESSKVSHVGVYLQNGYFVHASSSRGVVINNLSENYYAKYFYKGGRLPGTSDQP